jgi:hypothetical protein
MVEQRNRMGPIPADPENHITEQQVNGLTILKKFGWKLVCVRRSHDPVVASTTILRNKQEGTVGILESNGILTISDSLQIRDRKDSADVLEFNTKRLIERMNDISFTRRLF